MSGTDDDEAPRGPPAATPQRGRLRRSGRMLPLVRPGTIAPPAKPGPGEDAPDDYDEVSIEPIREPDADPDDEETGPGQSRP